MMPTISGESYAAPGKALASVGQAIGNLGEALAGQMNKEDAFRDQLAIHNYDGEESIRSIKSQQEFNREDPNGWAIEQHTQRQQRFNNMMASLRTDEGRKRAQTYWATRGNNFYEHETSFEYGKRHEVIAKGTESAVASEYAKIDFNADPDTVVESIKAAQRNSSAIINSATLPKKDGLYAKSAEHAINGLRRAFTDETGHIKPEFYDAQAKLLEDLGGATLPPKPGSAPTGPVSLGAKGADYQARSGPGVIAAQLSAPRTINSEGYGERTSGTITVNGRTYEFINGGSRRGSIPNGEYQIGRFTPGQQRAALGRSFTRDAFELSDVQDDSPRASKEDKRRGLLIHDARGGVTAGCIGIKGDFEQFKRDLQVEMGRNGGKMTMSLGLPGGGGQAGGGITPKLTAYSPQAGGSQMEGGYAAAKPGPDGKAEVRTLEDVRDGKSDYITIAGDPSQNGKSYIIPEIKWIDKNGKLQISQNIKAVVHDTGSAFKGKGEERFDIPVAKDMTDAQMNAQPFLRGGVKLVAASAAPSEGQAAPQGGKQRVSLAGMDDKQKAAKLEELVSQGYQGIVHQLDKDGNDVLIVRPSDKPSWHINSRGKGDGPSELDRPEFSGPAWAGESIKKIKSGELRAQNTIPGGPVRVADASGRTVPGNVDPAALRLREILINKQDEFARERAVAEMRIVGEASTSIDQIVEHAKSGGDVGNKMVDDITDKLFKMNPALVAKFGLEEKLTEALDFADQAQEYKLLNLQQQETVLSQRQKWLAANIDKLPAAAVKAETDAIKRFEALHNNAKEGMKKDLLSWAEKVGVQEVPETNWGDPASIIQRVTDAKAIAEHFGTDPQFFKEGDKKLLTDKLKAGGPEMLAGLKILYQGFGPTGNMEKAMAQLGKLAPEVAMAGWMMNAGHNLGTIDDLAAGIQRQRMREMGDKKTAEIKHTDSRKVFIDTYGQAFSRMPGTEGAIIESANAIYEARGARKGWTDPKPDEYKKILAEVVGQTVDDKGATFGGIQTVGGMFDKSITDSGIGYSNSIVLPMNVRNTWSIGAPFGTGGGNSYKQLVDSIRIDDLVRQDRASSGPATGDGKPLGIDSVRRATPVTIGPGQYWLATGDPNSDDPKFIKHGTTGNNYVLDLSALEGTLKSRRPDLYKGYQEKSWAPGVNQMQFTGDLQHGSDVMQGVQQMAPKNYQPGPTESTNVIDERPSTTYTQGRNAGRSVGQIPMPTSDQTPDQLKGLLPN